MSRATSRAPSSRSPTPRSTASTSATILSDHPIAARWREVRGEGRAALIPYLTAGVSPTPAPPHAPRPAETAGAAGVEGGGPLNHPPAHRPPDSPTPPARPRDGGTHGGAVAPDP